MSLTRSCMVAAAVAVLGQSADAATITISRLDCSRIVRHVPAPDVAYQPGVDVRGRAVAPADLDGGFSVEPPERFTIEITIDLRKRLGLPPDPTLYKPDVKAGTVVYRDGQAWFNGQPLATEGASEIARVCRERFGAPQ